MKKLNILVAFLLIMLLCSALAEDECPHMMVVKMATSHAVIEPREAGHYRCNIINYMCLDCKKTFVDKQYGDLTGHIFHMAESIHFASDGMHLWVFICPECMYITMLEEPCTGSENCMLYSAQAGERPAVQLADSLGAWKEANQKNDIVKRWLAQDRSK